MKPCQATQERFRPFETGGDQRTSDHIIARQSTSALLRSTPDQSRPCHSISDDSRSLLATLDLSRPLETTSGRCRPHMSSADNFRSLPTTQEHARPRETMRDHARQSTSISDNSSAHKASPDHCRPLQTKSERPPVSRPDQHVARVAARLDRGRLVRGAGGREERLVRRGVGDQRVEWHGRRLMDRRTWPCGGMAWN